MQQPGFTCQYHQLVDDQALAGSDRVLAVVTFANRIPSSGPPVIATGLPLLYPANRMEVLTQWAPVRHHRQADCELAETDELLLAILRSRGDSESMEAASERLYTRLLEQLQARGYPHLVRIWNYLADINREDAGGERYRQFCVGRYQAFARLGVAASDFPSACALGQTGDDLLVYALAAKRAPTHYENPRQVSAYHYPAQYSPRSPSFARASLLQLPDRPAILFVSGTASVVGHKTHYPDDIEGQLATTLQNLEALLAHVVDSQRSPASLQADQLKVYLRRPDDLALVRAGVEAHFGSVPAVYLQSDICRRELLLEIEGTWSFAP